MVGWLQLVLWGGLWLVTKCAPSAHQVCGPSMHQVKEPLQIFGIPSGSSPKDPIGTLTWLVGCNWCWIMCLAGGWFSSFTKCAPSVRQVRWCFLTYVAVTFFSGFLLDHHPRTPLAPWHGWLEYHFPKSCAWLTLGMAVVMAAVGSPADGRMLPSLFNTEDGISEFLLDHHPRTPLAP